MLQVHNGSQVDIIYIVNKCSYVDGGINRCTETGNYLTNNLLNTCGVYNNVNMQHVRVRNVNEQTNKHEKNQVQQLETSN